MMTTNVTNATFSRTGSGAAKSTSESERNPGDDFSALLASLLFAPVMQPGSSPAPAEESSVDSSDTAAIESGVAVSPVSLDAGLGQPPLPPAPDVVAQDVKAASCAQSLPDQNPITLGGVAGPVVEAEPAEVAGARAVAASESQPPTAPATQTLGVIKVPGPAQRDIQPSPITKTPSDAPVNSIVIAPAETTPNPIDKPTSDKHPDLVVLTKDADTTLQAQAAQRDASFIAGYLAGNSRVNPMLAIKNQLANGSDLDSNARHNAELLSGGPAMRTIQSDISFAAVAGAVESGAEVPALQVGRHMLTLTDDLGARQTRSIRLRLHPEDLGEVEIQLTRNAQGKVSAHLEAERETTRLALSQSLGQLRETLERAGVTVDRLQVKAWTGSLAGHSNNHDDQRNRSQTPTGTVKSVAATETEVGPAAGLHDHKLLSLNA